MFVGISRSVLAKITSITKFFTKIQTSPFHFLRERLTENFNLLTIRRCARFIPRESSEVLTKRQEHARDTD